MRHTFIVPLDACRQRFDKFVACSLPDVSRTKIAELIKLGKAAVNAQTKKPGYSLPAGAMVTVDVPEEIPFCITAYPCDIPLVFEDDDIMVVNKPGGMNTHPPQHGSADTLVNALVYMGKILAPINPLRPGIVHRLDRDTSGLLVIAKTNRAYMHLSNQFRKRVVKKEYRAIVWGEMEKDDTTVDVPMARDEKHRLCMKISFVNAKNALTYISVLERLSGATYIALRIHTGRMHQIRVHTKFLGHPIVGDKKYGIKDAYTELFLHAHTLGLYHPVTGAWMDFEASVPERFTKFIAEKKQQ